MIKIPSKPLVLNDPSQHTMSNSLLQYVQTRTHEFVDELEYKKITVLGKYDRSQRSSKKEKQDKLENWQRPTAKLVSGELQICCFPGQAYVFHYASLIATYLALTKRNPNTVSFLAPTDEECEAAIRKANFSQIKTSDILIVSSGISNLTTVTGFVDYGCFQTKQEIIGKSSVTWLAVKHSFWGDIAYWLGSALAKCGFPMVLFIGKLGSLNPEHVPNETLATGSMSVLDGELIQWQNFFSALPKRPWIEGKHISLPSVLQETISWQTTNKERYMFVDPEIGNLAKGVLSNGSSFSYIHIISDNISKDFKEDLSNERDGQIPQKRIQLYKLIMNIIQERLNKKI